MCNWFSPNFIILGTYQSAYQPKIVFNMKKSRPSSVARFRVYSKFVWCIRLSVHVHSQSCVMFSQCDNPVCPCKFPIMCNGSVSEMFLSVPVHSLTCSLFHQCDICVCPSPRTSLQASKQYWCTQNLFTKLIYQTHVHRTS